jgi:hypothetical protein
MFRGDEPEFTRGLHRARAAGHVRAYRRTTGRTTGPDRAFGVLTTGSDRA